MIKLYNMGLNEFKKYCVQKKVYIYGAGRALESCLDLYFKDKQISGIVDSDKNKVNKVISYGIYKTKIVDIDTLKKIIASDNDKKNILIMISSSIYGADIVDKLDKMYELDGIECFLQLFIRNTREEYCDFEFTKTEKKIPKKIHYVWVGEMRIPYEFQKNIKTWKKFNPDYEIIEWNEKNYDMNVNKYVKQAYESKAWGFVSNYMRLDIVYKYGGIYLDTDVEAISNFDKLLNDELFMCMGCADRVNNGCGFGAIAGHKILKDIIAEFDDIEFLKDKKPQKKPGHTFLHPILRKYGFKIENRYQCINDAVLYPAEVMSPLRLEGMEDWISDKTVSLHKESSTWRNIKEKEAYRRTIELINRIVQR